MPYLMTGRSIRIVGVAAALVGGFIVPIAPALALPLTWVALPVASVVGAVAVPLLFLSRTWLDHGGSRSWTRPSWKKNPFSWVDPIQFFHFVAFLCMAQSVTSSLRAFLSYGRLDPECALPLAIGSGILIGVYLTAGVMPASFRSEEDVPR
jgi:hypothetical protein